MSLQDFLFEFEELELKAQVISATFAYCYEDLVGQADEKAEFVIAGLFEQINELSKQIVEAYKYGWNEVQRGVI